ncbi:hypothetical protein B0H11DRAFT_1934108 [Mycena galericulata]|nr:hypothetical protein B0H11DRAFT_1934108 [Mycena galericulata]
MSVYMNGILAPSWSCSGLAHSSVFAASLCVPPVASWAFLVFMDAGQYGVHSMTLISRTLSLIDTIPSPSGPGCVSGASQFSSVGSSVNARIPTFVETNGAPRLHFTPTVININPHMFPLRLSDSSLTHPIPQNPFLVLIHLRRMYRLSDPIYLLPLLAFLLSSLRSCLQPRLRKVGSGSTPSRYKSPRLIDGQRFLAAYLPSPNPSQNLFPAGKPELERLLKHAGWSDNCECSALTSAYDTQKSMAFAAFSFLLSVSASSLPDDHVEHVGLCLGAPHSVALSRVACYSFLGTKCREIIATHASQNPATSIFDQMENLPKGTLLALPVPTE